MTEGSGGKKKTRTNPLEMCRGASKGREWGLGPKDLGSSEASFRCFSRSLAVPFLSNSGFWTGLLLALVWFFVSLAGEESCDNSLGLCFCTEPQLPCVEQLHVCSGVGSPRGREGTVDSLFGVPHADRAAFVSL